MLDWNYFETKLKLTRPWEISRGRIAHKTVSLIEIFDGKVKGLGEAACMTGYPFTHKEVAAEFKQKLNADLLYMLQHPRDVEVYLAKKDILPPLRFAIESAFTLYFVQKINTSVADLLELKLPRKVKTAASLGINDPLDILTPAELKAPYVKVKVNDQNMVEKVQAIHAKLRKPLLIDPNGAYMHAETLLADLERLKHVDIALVEQPFPADRPDLFAAIAGKTSVPIFADESVNTAADFETWKEHIDGVVVKLQKTGGLYAAKALIEAARKENKQVMMGCSIESSVGIWFALHFAALADFIDLDGNRLIENDPFAWVEDGEDGLKPVKLKRHPALAIAPQP